MYNLQGIKISNILIIGDNYKFCDNIYWFMIYINGQHQSLTGFYSRDITYQLVYFTL